MYYLNRPISIKSNKLLRCLFETHPDIQIAQYLCNTAMYEKDKLRSIAVRFLSSSLHLFTTSQDSMIAIVKK